MFKFQIFTITLKNSKCSIYSIFQFNLSYNIRVVLYYIALTVCKIINIPKKIFLLRNSQIIKVKWTSNFYKFHLKFNITLLTAGICFVYVDTTYNLYFYSVSLMFLGNTQSNKYKQFLNIILHFSSDFTVKNCYR